MTRSRASCPSGRTPQANLWQIVKPLVRQVAISEDAVLVVDDSIAHKPHTDTSELIGWHYDHTTGTSVKGINFLTALYCVGEVSLPCGLRPGREGRRVHGQKDGPDQAAGHG